MSLFTPVPGVDVVTFTEESEIQRTSAACPAKLATITAVTFSNPKLDPVMVTVADPSVGTLAGHALTAPGPTNSNW